jgi:hypothetical protein
MENFLLYLLKVNALLTLFFLAYHFLLRKETFFQSNRWFLLLGIAGSFIIPTLLFTSIVWIAPQPILEYSSVILPTNASIVSQQISEEKFNWSLYFSIPYLLISSYFLLKLILELFSFFRIVNQGKKSIQNKIQFIETEENQSPFSFFNYLVFNKSNFTEEELEYIFIHEKIHIEQQHSFDVLITKMLCLFFWINPIVWLYRKAILENLEFIADAKTAKITTNIYQYQKTLLKTIINKNQLSITNQFYQSLIKKRIVMLNTNQSSRKKLWKYSIVVPFLVAFIFFFQHETIAQVKETEETISSHSTTQSTSKIEFTINKKTTDKELEEISNALRESYGIQLEFNKIKRNKQNEIIRIKATANTDKTYNSVIEIDENEGIDPFTIIANENNDNEKTITYIRPNAINAQQAPTSTNTINNEINTINYHGWKIEQDKLDKNPVLFVVNDVIQSTGSNIKFDYTVEVTNSKELSEKDAIKKYGNIGRNGAYEFKVKKYEPINQLYIINDKEYLSEELKGKKITLDGTIIHYSNKEAQQKYGDKGKNGVLLFKGKATISEGKKDVIHFISTVVTNVEPKNIKLEFEEDKTYIINNKKYDYTTLKSKDWWLYNDGNNKIEEKNGITYITGDVVENAAEWNTQEIIEVNHEVKKSESKIITLDNDKKIYITNGLIKIPSFPALELKALDIELDGNKIANKAQFFEQKNLNFIKDITMDNDMKVVKVVTYKEVKKSVPNFDNIEKEIQIAVSKLHEKVTDIITENGNHSVLFDHNQLKIPGLPTIIIYQNSPEIYVNGKKLSNAQNFIKMDHSKIYFLDALEKMTVENGRIKVLKLDVKTR